MSALIVDYFTAPQTAKLVAQLKKEASVGEIVVVDNTGDRSYDSLDELVGITLVRNHQRAGYGAGINLAARSASGDFLLVLNSDIKLLRGELSTLTKTLQLRPEVGIVAPRIVDQSGAPQADAGRRYPRRWFRTHPERDHRWVTGAAFLISRGLFQSIGGFDEKYFMYWEDVDLCKRVLDCGLSTMVSEEVLVEHVSGLSSAGVIPRYEFAYRSRTTYMEKHGYPAVQRHSLNILGRGKLEMLRLLER